MKNKFLKKSENMNQDYCAKVVRLGDNKEINFYVDENINIISLNVTPEKVSDTDCEGDLLIVPIYWYHISLVYTSNEE